jgi:hypothetical protein
MHECFWENEQVGIDQGYQFVRFEDWYKLTT